jgi:membrane-bound serine protease (ClpP class)
MAGRARPGRAIVSGEALLYWGIALIAISLLMLVIEGFVPSAGLIGITAGITAVVGVGMLFRYETVWGVTGLLTVAVLGPLAFFGALKIMPSTPIGRALLGEIPDDEMAERELVVREAVDQRRALIGLTGSAITDMRPIGEIEVGGTSHEALADAGWIEAGTPIEVVAADGMEIKVRAIG